MNDQPQTNMEFYSMNTTKHEEEVNSDTSDDEEIQQIIKNVNKPKKQT
jgi:hypothetical protein